MASHSSHSIYLARRFPLPSDAPHHLDGGCAISVKQSCVGLLAAGSISLYEMTCENNRAYKCALKKPQNDLLRLISPHAREKSNRPRVSGETWTTVDSSCQSSACATDTVLLWLLPKSVKKFLIRSQSPPVSYSPDDSAAKELRISLANHPANC